MMRRLLASQGLSPPIVFHRLQAARAAYATESSGYKDFAVGAAATETAPSEGASTSAASSEASGYKDIGGSSGIDAAESTSGSEDTGYTGTPRIVVFGGRGFVGSHVCQEALNTGLQVVGISRSGTPPPIKASWVDQVEWVRGSGQEPRTYSQHLQGAVAAISCIGGFGNTAEAYKVNGTANIAVIEACKAAGIPRFVYVSANIPNVPGLEYLLGGYIKGKEATEAALRQHYPDTGVILRPGIIHGNRTISSGVTVPLSYAFGPLETLVGYLPSKQLSGVPVVGAAFVPPSSVEAVARAAVRAATDGSVPAGVVDPWDLAKFK